MSGIGADLVRIDEDWQEWGFPQLVAALRKWSTRYPKLIMSPKIGFKRENAYQANDKNCKQRDWFYYKKLGHETYHCKAVSDIKESQLDTF